jgi:hypothetical protein
MNIYKFKLYLNSDTGKHSVILAADTETAARNIICDIYNCPMSAIYSIRNLGVLKGLKQ